MNNGVKVPGISYIPGSTFALFLTLPNQLSFEITLIPYLNG